MKSILFLGSDAAYLHAFRSPLMRRFRDQGYRVVAVAAPCGDFDASVFDAIGVEFLPWGVERASLDPFADLRAARALWRIFRTVRPTILFAHTIKAVIYGLVLGRPAGIPRRTVMIPGLGYAFTEDRGLKRRLVGRIARLGYRMALSLADLVIFQNRDDLETLRRAGALKAATPTGVVNGSGVDMDRFQPGPWPSGPPRFLMLARLLRDKGVFEYVAAARIVRERHPNARFVLAGGADANPASVTPDQLQAWIAEGVIEVPGHVSDPRDLFAGCHVFVLPSYYMEGCPRVNLEAMAMARPLITTDWVGCRETIVDGVNGLMTPVRDVDALARAMLTLAGDLDLARRMGEAGLRMCRDRFELNAVTQATVDLIEGDRA